MATTVLTNISSTAWEHPADRAALNTLRAIPGFDAVIKRIAGFIGDRALRQLFLGSAVRVGPTQRPQLDAMLTEVLATLDWAERPELYVTQSPVLNAAAVGFERPFIVLNSSVLEHLTPDEQRAMEGMLAEALEAGAFGFSTGLVYPPSVYASTDELIARSRRDRMAQSAPVAESSEGPRDTQPPLQGFLDDFDDEPATMVGNLAQLGAIGGGEHEADRKSVV